MQSIIHHKSISNVKNVEIEVILGLGYMHKSMLDRIVKKMKNDGYKINFTERTDMLSKHFVDCDFVITSNGRTVFECSYACFSDKNHKN